MAPSPDAGYALVERVQAARGPLLDPVMQGVTFLGDELFYLVFLSLLYWGVDRALAARLTVLFLCSAYLNQLLKVWADLPRPSPERVHVLDSRPTGGLPSGHAQNSAVTWGYLASAVSGRRGRLSAGIGWALALVLILLIGFSRIYLGAHFPQDVAAGWAVGLGLLGIFLVLAVRVEGWWAGWSLPVRMGLAAAAPLLFLVLFREAEALPAAAALMGVGVGIVVEREWVGFDARARQGWRRGGRCLVGLVGALLIWAGAPVLVQPLGEAGTVIQYAALGGWITGAAPWLFLRTGLGGTEEVGSRGASTGGPEGAPPGRTAGSRESP